MEESIVDLNQLPVFAAITENRSFTKAAAPLLMDKAIVSNKLSQLETRMRVQLLNRSTRSINKSPESLLPVKRVCFAHWII